MSNPQPDPVRMDAARAHRLTDIDINRRAAALFYDERTPTQVTNDVQWGDLAPTDRQRYMARARRGDRP